MNRAAWKQTLRRKWLWWKHTGWFQLAHKPLCSRFHRHVWRIGSVRLCRSCVLLYSALAATGLALLAFPPAPSRLATAAVACLLPVVALSYPPLYRRWPRIARDVLRSGLGVSLALVIALPFVGETALFAALAGFIIAARWLCYRKRGDAKKIACTGCPELGTGEICSGFRLQAESIRAFQNAVEEEINQPGFVPVVVRKKAR